MQLQIIRLKLSAIPLYKSVTKNNYKYQESLHGKEILQSYQRAKIYTSSRQDARKRKSNIEDLIAYVSLAQENEVFK